MRQEESRLKVMMGPPVIPSESSALSTNSSPCVTQEKDSKTETGLLARKTGSKSNSYVKKYCKYCHREGHLVEECYRRPGSTVKPPPFLGHTIKDRIMQEDHIQVALGDLMLTLGVLPGLQ